jgi:hypothetical protein
LLCPEHLQLTEFDSIVGHTCSLSLQQSLVKWHLSSHMHFPSSDWPPHFPLQLECPAALEKNEMPPSTLFKIETLPSIITFWQDLA